MSHVIVLPCRSRQARFRRAVFTGLAHEGLRAQGLEPQSLRLPATGPLRAWALPDGRAHNAIWTKAEPGDTAIFLSGHRVLAAGSVFSLLESEELSQLLWTPTKRERACTRILVLTDVRFGDAPFGPVGEALGLAAPPRSASITSGSLSPTAVFDIMPEQDHSVERGSLEDEMTTWHRQGLVGRLVALRAARTGMDKGEPGAEASIRRIVRALAGPRTQHRFPVVANSAVAVQATNGRLRDRGQGVARRAS